MCALYIIHVEFPKPWWFWKFDFSANRGYEELVHIYCETILLEPLEMVSARDDVTIPNEDVGAVSWVQSFMLELI